MTEFRGKSAGAGVIARRRASGRKLQNKRVGSRRDRSKPVVAILHKSCVISLAWLGGWFWGTDIRRGRA